MKKLTVTLAALGLMLTVACTKKDDVHTPAASVDAKEQALNDTFRKMDSSYQASDRSLANMVKALQGGLRLDGISTEDSSLEFSVLISALEKTVFSDPVAINDKIRKGEVFDFPIVDEDKINQALDAWLTASGKCLDTDCNRLALLLKLTPGSSAGYILVKGQNNVYGIETSVGPAIDMDTFIMRRKALDREEDETPVVKGE